MLLNNRSEGFQSIQFVAFDLSEFQGYMLDILK